MKIYVTVDYDKKEDGFDGTYTFSRDDMVDLTEMAQFFNNVVNGIGYNYVEDVCFLTEGGTEWWGFKL